MKKFLLQMEFIQNVYPGACTSIVFYQFVKSSGNLSYNDLEKFVNSLNSVLGNDLHIIGQHLVKYWDGIQNGSIKFKNLPYGGDLREIDESIPDIGIFGKSEYGLISYFCRVLFWAQTGYWIQVIGGKTYEEARKYGIHGDHFDKYTAFMLKYTQSIPYVSYVAYVDEKKIVLDIFHVILTIRNGEQFMIYDSNRCDVMTINFYSELWYTEE